MKTAFTILRWVATGFFFLMLLATGFHYSSLFLLGAIGLVFPLPAADKLRNKLKIKPLIGMLLAGILFFTAILTAPTPKPPSSDPFFPQYTDAEQSSNATAGTDVPLSSSDTSDQNSNATDNSQHTSPVTTEPNPSEEENPETTDLSKLPAYSGAPYVTVNNNIPRFSKDQLTTYSYESYSTLDSLGRCGICIASIGKDLMPTENRGDIGSVKPTGWQSIKYDHIEGKYLYNRCHLIGYQLSGENANEKNLITGTRYLNTEGMLPFENMIADYVKETGNHVALRVTPFFEGTNLVASGVQMEAYSIEDNGEGICFNVYCYNVQPGVTINYADGTSRIKFDQNSNQTESTDTADTTTSSQPDQENFTYVLNTKSKKFHYPSCASAKKISPENYAKTSESRESLTSKGYRPCGNCDP